MKAYAGYLFDLDGTLVDSAPDLHVCLNYALTRHDYASVDIAHTRHWIGQGARAMVAQALAAQLNAEPDDALLDRVCDDFLPYYQDHLADHSRLYPHVRSTLQTLQQRGAALAVVTNKIEQFTTGVLAQLELTAFFTTVVCGDTTDHPKPAADPALHACRELGVDIREVLFVGDSSADVNCARAAGCDVVCVRGGYSHGIPADELGADRVIESFRDLV
jgi:phosphoglycolate phosphatase